METVWRKAFDPETRLEYQIEMPAPAVVRQAILKLPFPPAGMTIKNAVEILAEKFGLSEEQKNAGYKSEDNIFYHGVQTQFRNLLEADKLKQSEGSGTPYFLENPPITDLSPVLAKINKIVEKSADGDYIYRGEQECHEKVSSSLYREYPHREGTHFDIVSAQETILEEAKAYIGKTGDIDETDNIGILTEIQHFGGKTNLIDFTEDYLIALFFACDGSHDKDGRVILLKRESETKDYKIEHPRRTISRVESQKSIFVESPTGFVEPDIEVTIPAELKMPMLDYLKKHHRMSIPNIYNDLHGFIRRSAYGEFLKGLTWQSKSEEAKKPDPCENAIKHYTETLKLNPDFAEAYNNRGVAYKDKGELDKAIENYNTAIALNPDFAEAYINRGVANYHKGEVNKAIEDYSTAIDLNPELAEAYNNRGNAYRRKGKLDNAIQDFNKAIALNSQYANAYTNRGDTYGKKGELDNAIQDYNIAIDLKPEFAGAYNNRGAAYGKKGELDTAIQDFNTAIALNPDFAAAYNNRGIAYKDKGELDNAIQDYTEALKLNPENAYAYANRGEAWLYLSEWENAKADLNTAKDMGFDIVASFYTAYESVADFEAKHGVQVPEDIAALLSGD